MKRTLVRSLSFIFLMTAGSISAMECKNQLYIENNSGWAITIHGDAINGSWFELPMRKGETLKSMGCLQQIKMITFQRRGQVWGIGASAAPLDDQLKMLQSEAHSHKGKDAIIVINATMTEWKYDTRWESAIQG